MLPALHPTTGQTLLIAHLLLVDIVLWGLLLIPLAVLGRWSLTARLAPMRGLRAVVVAVCENRVWKRAEDLAGLLALVLALFTPWGWVIAMVGIALLWPYALRGLAGWKKPVNG